jgi:hypothetical protein
VAAFTDEKKAVERAKARAHEFDRWKCLEERRVQGCLYYANIGPEGDCVYAIEVEADSGEMKG